MSVSATIPVPRMLTFEAAADILSCHVATIRRIVNAGRLSVVHTTPGSVRISTAELVKYIDANTRIAPPAATPKRGRGRPRKAAIAA